MHADNRHTGTAAAAYQAAAKCATRQRTERPNPAAPPLEPPFFLGGFLEQFARPSGWLGRLAGVLMARTASDDRWVVDLLDVQPADRVLDVGCGPGVTLQLLAERERTGLVAGIDPSDVMLKQASRRNRRAIEQGRLVLCRATAAHAPFPADTFNKACAVHSVYFWPALDEGLLELQRVLSPGGLAVIAVRMQHARAARLDPSRYGLTEENLQAIARTAEFFGFREVIINREVELDRQTMAAVSMRR